MNEMFPDPSTLDPQDRLNRVNEYRARVLNDEKLSDEELSYAIKLIRADRQVSETSAPKRAAAKAPAKPISLDEF